MLHNSPHTLLLSHNFLIFLKINDFRGKKWRARTWKKKDEKFFSLNVAKILAEFRPKMSYHRHQVGRKSESALRWPSNSPPLALCARRRECRQPTNRVKTLPLKSFDSFSLCQVDYGHRLLLSLSRCVEIEIYFNFTSRLEQQTEKNMIAWRELMKRMSKRCSKRYDDDE